MSEEPAEPTFEELEAEERALERRVQKERNRIAPLQRDLREAQRGNLRDRARELQAQIREREEDLHAAERKHARAEQNLTRARRRRAALRDAPVQPPQSPPPAPLPPGEAPPLT